MVIDSNWRWFNSTIVFEWTLNLPIVSKRAIFESRIRLLKLYLGDDRWVKNCNNFECHYTFPSINTYSLYFCILSRCCRSKDCNRVRQFSNQVIYYVQIISPLKIFTPLSQGGLIGGSIGLKKNNFLNRLLFL